MFVVEYVLLMIACSSGLGLFGFFLGRCGRKVPIIDNRLPWTMYSGEVRHGDEDSQSHSAGIGGSTADGSNVWPRQQSRRQA